MFGFFKRRRVARIARGMVAGVDIAAAFECLRREAPAAAYFFARTLVNSRPLLDDTTKTRREKIRTMEAEMAYLQASRGERADGGISILALQFLRALLAAQQQDVDLSLGYSAAFGDIAKHGESHRQLEPRDRLPPSDHTSNAILAKQGHACVGDLIDALIAECREKGYDLSAIDEDQQTILALFDLRDEASSGRLLPRMKGLAAALRVSYSPETHD